jgi:hypothetical protein
MGLPAITYQHKVGEADDATGPIRTRRVKKASNLTLTRGDIVALATGTALKATNATPGPFGVVKHTVLDTEAKPEVEIYIDTKATIYVKGGGVIKGEAYVKVAATNKVIAQVPGTDLDFTLLLGRYVKHGTKDYDGKNSLQDAADNDIIGIILGLQ